MAAGNPQNTSPSNGYKSESRSSPLKKPAGKKGKAGSSKKMSQKEQSERFIETARKLGANEDEENFEKILDKLLPEKS